MKSNILIICISLMILGCNQKKQESAPPLIAETPATMTNEMVSQMQWMHEPDYEINEGILEITAIKGTDFFNNPEDSSITGTAPFLYISTDSDFAAKALVRPDFSSQWNAISLMVYLDSLNWIKFAFENSDATGPGIVSVVTKNTSDDSNGAVLEDEEQVWLAIVRKGSIYSLHWSKDGEHYYMARLTTMPDVKEVKIGIEAQCPVGESATHKIISFEIEEVSVKDMRNL